MICLEKMNDNFIFADCNTCNIKYHKYCYQEFRDKSDYKCPICRIKEKKEYFNDPLFDFVFSFPTPIALILWFIISFAFTLLLFPQMISYHIFEYNKIVSITISFIHLYSIFWVCSLLTI